MDPWMPRCLRCSQLSRLSRLLRSSFAEGWGICWLRKMQKPFHPSNLMGDGISSMKKDGGWTWTTWKVPTKQGERPNQVNFHGHPIWPMYETETRLISETGPLFYWLPWAGKLIHESKTTQSGSMVFIFHFRFQLVSIAVHCDSSRLTVE